jgi:glucose-6-phosphate 1-dehydrogenase
MPEHTTDNPFHTEPAIFVIFGITGDLAQRRLLPALYHLVKDKLLHEHTAIVGVSRKALSPDELLAKVELCVLEADNVCDPVALADFRQRLRMVQLDPNAPDDYDRLRTTLDGIEQAHGMCMNRLFYLSIPPHVYQPIIQNLGEHRLNIGCDHKRELSRLLVEKPFGYDLPSAEELIRNTAEHFTEEQVFRIDHYLAKETVQNILVFRKQNPIFMGLWDKTHIRSIEIDMSEQIGIEGRSEFYDSVGALRDVVQNHLLQLLALVTMELPKATDSATLHEAKQQLLSQVHPADPIKTIRAQYAGYHEAVANPSSTTETYVRVSLTIDNERWQDVPVTITTGKALQNKRTAITMTFGEKDIAAANKLVFRIQPNEGIAVELLVKRPGFDTKTEVVDMDFSYHGVFSEPEHPDAYERVLIDAIRGDHSLFATSEEVLAAWRILQPILTAWQQSSTDLRTYEQHSAGPQ